MAYPFGGPPSLALSSSPSSPSETWLWRAGTVVVLVEAVLCLLEIAARVSVFDCDVIVLVEAVVCLFEIAAHISVFDCEVGQSVMIL